MRQGAKEAMKRELDCTSAAKRTCWYELFTLARAAFICSVALALVVAICEAMRDGSGFLIP